MAVILVLKYFESKHGVRRIFSGRVYGCENCISMPVIILSLNIRDGCWGMQVGRFITCFFCRFLVEIAFLELIVRSLHFGPKIHCSIRP